jgi:trans-aconitate methyltransferase
VDSRVEALLADQMRYYEDRATEFEDCYYRRGLHDMGPEFNERWFREIADLEAAVQALPVTGRVLELACGTGLWTRFLASRADRLVAVDSSEEMIRLNRERVNDSRVTYVRDDLFEWRPGAGQVFEAIFIGFFLSHVPPDRLGRLWERLGSWLAPDGVVAFCDDRDGPDRPYSGDTVADGPSFAHRRQLSGGRSYTIVKVFYSPDELGHLLRGLGWNAEVHATGEHFLYGTASRVPAIR